MPPVPSPVAPARGRGAGGRRDADERRAEQDRRRRRRRRRDRARDDRGANVAIVATGRSATIVRSRAGTRRDAATTVEAPCRIWPAAATTASLDGGGGRESRSAMGSAQASEDALDADRCVEQYGLLAVDGPGDAGVAQGMGVTGWTVRVAVSSWGLSSRPKSRRRGLTTSGEPYHGRCDPGKQETGDGRRNVTRSARACATRRVAPAGDPPRPTRRGSWSGWPGTRRSTASSPAG